MLVGDARPAGIQFESGSRITGAPNEMLGTKWPSITSMWSQSGVPGVERLGGVVGESAEVGG